MAISQNDLQHLQQDQQDKHRDVQAPKSRDFSANGHQHGQKHSAQQIEHRTVSLNPLQQGISKGQTRQTRQDQTEHGVNRVQEQRQGLYAQEA